MPTIHLSVPEKIYRELKEAADKYDIQVTDLVKIFIRSNIKLAKMGILNPTGSSDSDTVKILEEKVKSIERTLDYMSSSQDIYIKALTKMLKKLEERINQLENELEEIKESVGIEKPIIDPELLDR